MLTFNTRNEAGGRAFGGGGGGGRGTGGLILRDVSISNIKVVSAAYKMLYVFFLN